MATDKPPRSGAKVADNAAPSRNAMPAEARTVKSELGPKKKRVEKPRRPAKKATKGEAPVVSAEAAPAVTEAAPVEERPATTPKSKIEAAGVATGSRAEVIQDAIRRDEERTARRNVREAFHSGWGMMQAAMKAEIMLSGTVTGAFTQWLTVQTTPNEDDDLTPEFLKIPKVVVVVFMDDLFKVSIPFEELFVGEPIDMSTVDTSTQAGLNKLSHRQLNMAMKFVGTEIEFIVTSMDDIRKCTPDDHFILASRRAALLKRRRLSFFPDRSGRIAIKEGDDVDGTIIGVAVHSLRICIGGVDVSVPIAALTHRWVPDATNEYRPGQKIRVRVVRITINSNTDVILDVSTKPLERMYAMEHWNRLSVGLQVHGVITNLTKAKISPDMPVAEGSGGMIDARAWLPSYNMPVRIIEFPPLRYGEFPRTGDEVLLSIVGLSEYGMVKAHLLRRTGRQYN